MFNTTTIILLILLVFLSAFFSATETAFSTCNRIRLKNQAEKGNQKAEKALQLLENYDNLITTILIGNNFVNIANASLAAALFTTIYGSNGPTISTFVMTAIVLIFGEIVPKSFANRFADSYVLAVANIMNILEIVLYPLTFIFGLIKKLIMSIFKDEGNDKETLTNDELITMVNEVEKEGSMEAEESELVRSAIEFNDLDVRDILTPRVKVIAINKDWPIDKIHETFKSNPFSRLPVYEEDIDHIIGFIHERDFYIHYEDEDFDINSIIRPLIVVPLSYSMIDALQLMQRNKTHISIVADEYGGTQGIITMEDILEELVGEIWDEHDQIEREMVQIDDSTWNFTGGCSLVDMMSCFRLHDDDPDFFDSDTVGGFVCEVLERMPNRGEKFEYKDLTITVLDVDDRVVKRVRVHQNEEENETE